MPRKPASGNAAIKTNRRLTDLGETPKKQQRALTDLADEIASTISFGIGRKNRADDAPTSHPLFEDAAWDALEPRHRGNLREKAVDAR